MKKEQIILDIERKTAEAKSLNRLVEQYIYELLCEFPNHEICNEDGLGAYIKVFYDNNVEERMVLGLKAHDGHVLVNYGEGYVSLHESYVISGEFVFLVGEFIRVILNNATM